MRRAARVVARRIEEAFDGEELTPNQLFILLGLSLAEAARCRAWPICSGSITRR